MRIQIIIILLFLWIFSSILLTVAYEDGYEIDVNAKVPYKGHPNKEISKDDDEDDDNDDDDGPKELDKNKDDHDEHDEGPQNQDSPGKSQ
jgi:hypothetical protein